MPPWPCTIAFGLPGRAGREQHDERVVERHRCGRGERLGRTAASELRPGRGAVDPPVAVLDVERRGARVGSAGHDLGDLGAAVDVLAAVAVAAGDEQHDRLDLGEPVDHAARPELAARSWSRPRRARRRPGRRPAPPGSWAGSRPPGHPAGRRGRRSTRRARATCSRSSPQVSEESGAGLRARVARRPSSSRAPGAAQGVLGVVEQRPGEPARAGHHAARAARRCGCRGR